MSSSSPPGLPRWQSRTALSLLATCGLLAGAVSGVASASPADAPADAPAAGAAAPMAAAASDCPAAFPLGQVSEGLEVSGLTVSHGTQPEGFTGTIVGRIDDGIAPGIDMIIARMSGSEITDPATSEIGRGIWAGMSGSPVYAPNGRLIGAVAYGLTYSPSDYAGITPAAEMYRLRDYRSGAAPARSVEIPTGIARDMRSDGVSSRQLASGYHQLPMPLGVSGASEERLQQMAKRADYSGRGSIVSGFGASADEAATPIVTGGNLVASQSYGDITSAATGTATAICDGDVLGFGHPAAFLGRSHFTMHGADALYVETDTFGGSFKVSNPTAPVGSIIEDRTAGILGREGATPRATVVTSHVTATNGNQRNGRTTITQEIYRDDIPWLTMLHLYNNEQRVFDAAAKGSATLRWTVDLVRSDGTPMQYTRRNMYASADDVTYTTLWDLYEDIWRIVSNKYADVRVTGVHLQSDLDGAYRAFQLGRVQRFKDGRWTTLKAGGTIQATSGGILRLRGWLEPRTDSASVGRWVEFQVPVGRYSADRRGMLTVSGGASTSLKSKPDSLGQMLSAMSSAPTNASLWGKLQVRTADGLQLKHAHAGAPAPVNGSLSVTVKVAS
jgi:hypothetical protein